ncbi:MAG: Hsp20/alpha crystallin family protein [Bacteroidota bacterium]|nr:Hsp20/alpha crystallin family protein [Bacteroidota bacterium]
MTLIRRTPNDRLPNWFEDFFTNPEYSPNKAYNSSPSVNVAEKDDRYEIEMAVPGISKENIKVNVDNDVITISSETEESNKEEGKNYTRREFSYSSFARSFTLPESANKDEISASSKDGILTISIMKLDGSITKPEREIDIN